MRWIGGDGDLRRSVALVDTGPQIDWVSGQATYTSSGRNFGDPNPRRIIAVAVPMQSLDNSSELISGTIGGVTATVATQDDHHFTAIMYARVPNGSSGNISMTVNHVGNFVGFPLLYVYRIIAKNLTPFWAESYSNTISPMIFPLAVDVTPPRNSVTIAVGQNNTNRAATWSTWTATGGTDATGLIEDADASVMNGGAASCAHRGPETAANNRWRVQYVTDGGSGTRRGLSAATWN